MECRKGRKYPPDQQRVAVEYYSGGGHSPAATVRALGYPSRGLLRMWIETNTLRIGNFPIAIR